MSPPDLVIRAPAAAEIPRLFAHFGELRADNGRDGPLHDPRPRSAPTRDAEREQRFAVGLDIAVGEKGWRRAWVAFDRSGALAGHVDVRGHPEPCTEHRALLGLGVARDFRGRGLGRRLVEHVLDWARGETPIEWIDLPVLGGNEVAIRLYRSLGFRETVRVDDMFRIDGESVAKIEMTLRIAGRSAPSTLAPAR